MNVLEINIKVNQGRSKYGYQKALCHLIENSSFRLHFEFCIRFSCSVCVFVDTLVCDGDG